MFYVIVSVKTGITRIRKITKSRLAVPKTRKTLTMSDNRGSHPLFTDPKRLLLDMAQEQSLPELPEEDSLTLRRPSLVREAPSRPPVVCVFAVYRTFSS